MTPAQTLQVRTTLAQQIGQKAEAMRKEVEQETLRYEGAVGCLAQVAAMVTGKQSGVKASFSEGGTGHPEAEAKMAALSDVIAACEALAAQAQAQLSVQRGRMMQAEKYLDVLESVFAADVEAAKNLVAQDDADPVAVPQSPGRHPGPSLANKRRKASQAQKESGDA